MFRIHFSKALLAVLALAICTGTLQAATLVAAPTSITLTCDTVLGPGPAVNVGITLAAAGVALNVTPSVPAVALPAVSPIVVPGIASVGSTTVPVNFAFSMKPGCQGGTNGQTVTITFTPAAGTALTLTATLSITTANGSALAPSPSAVTITCIKAGGVYTPGATQTVNVTSPANGGTPFTVDNTTNPLPNWLQVTPLPGGTATATPVALSVVAKAGCGALPVGSTSFSVHLLNAPAPDKLLPVTIQIGATSTLSASVSPVALAYTKGSGTYNSVGTSITASPNVFFLVDQTSLPLWLNVDATSGTTSKTLNFVPTAGAETLALGSYSANVRLKVSGYLDFLLPVTLQVNKPAATLSVAEGTARTINWTIGTALPTLLITPISSDSPISYTVGTTAGTLSPQVNTTQGLAYSFGSPIAVTFLQAVFGGFAPGDVNIGHVIVTPTVGAPVDVTITVNVKSPAAVISSASPPSLPTAASGTVFNVALIGSGFVASADPTQKTKVGVVTGGFIVTDSNIVATVENANSIVLAITVPASADPYLPFSGAGGSVFLGVCNPGGATCSVPTGNVTLTIGVSPIVQAVTSASSYIQATPPALTAVAPYDILSVFGTDFCISGGTGCTGGNAILYGTTDPVTLRYLTSLSPDPAGATQRNVTVAFQTHAATPTLIANAPLLFATNGQINLLVPDAVKAYYGSTVDMVVSFGYGQAPNMLKSSPFSVTVANTDPGIFAIGGDGQGDAAALNASNANALVTSSVGAGARNPATDSDIIQLYVTGLGVPDSVDAQVAWAASGATCMAVGTYWAAVNTSASPNAALTSADGLVVQSALFTPGATAPCVRSASANVPSVTIGGVAGAVLYAGWVPDSVAGLYQINVRLPSSGSSFTDSAGAAVVAASLANPVSMPIVVTARGISSQISGVNLWVMGSLKMASTVTTTGTKNVTVWAGSVTASEGAPAYTYAVANGSPALPAGLSLDANSGAITGTPTVDSAATVVITATDSNGWTGNYSITFNITG